MLKIREILSTTTTTLPFPFVDWVIRILLLLPNGITNFLLTYEQNHSQYAFVRYYILTFQLKLPSNARKMVTQTRTKLNIMTRSHTANIMVLSCHCTDSVLCCQFIHPFIELTFLSTNLIDSLRFWRCQFKHFTSPSNTWTENEKFTLYWNSEYSFVHIFCAGMQLWHSCYTFNLTNRKLCSYFSFNYFNHMWMCARHVLHFMRSNCSVSF